MAGFGVLDWTNSGPTITVVATTRALGTPAGVTTSPGIDTTGATFIVIVLAAYTAAAALPTTPTDSKGNIYTLVRYDVNNVSPNLTGTAIYFCAAATVGAGHTFTTANTFTGIGVMALSGATALDQQNGFTGSFNPALQPGSITPTTAGTFIVFVVQNYVDTSAPSTPAGYTVLEAQPLVGGSTYAHGYYYLIQGAAAAVNPTSNVASEPFQQCSIANFK